LQPSGLRDALGEGVGGSACNAHVERYTPS
jgi:hypothetical protein